MSALELVLAIAGIWGLVGFAVFCSLPDTKRKLYMVLQGAIGGPFVWLLWILLTAAEYYDARKRRTP